MLSKDEQRKQRDDRIVELTRAGMTVRDIAAVLGCGQTTVQITRNRFDLVTHRSNKSGRPDTCQTCGKTIAPEGVAITDGFYMCEYYGRH